MSQREGLLRSLGRDTAIYGLGILLSRAASVIMLPVYTRYLTPADYGILQLLQITLDVAGIIVSAGLMAGVMRFYFKEEAQEARLRVASTALLLLLASNGLGTVILSLGAPMIGEHLLDDAAHAGLVRIVAFTFCLDSLTTVPMLLMQMQRRPVLYSVASISRLILQLSLNIYFVVGLGWGPKGVLSSSLITSVVMGTLLGGWMLRQTGLRVSRRAASDLWRFGLPYRLTTAGTFILTFGDRFFLKAYHDLDVVGLYGLAYQFGFILVQVMIIPYTRAWDPRRFEQAREPRAIRDGLYNRGFLIFSLLGITGAVGISLFVRPMLRIMAAPTFHGAADVVPLIVVAMIFMCWDGVMQFGAQVAEKPIAVTFSTWMAVAVMVGLYWALIPGWGAFGAALATLIGFAAQFLIQYHWSQKLWPISYRWQPILRLLGYGTLIILLGILLAGSDKNPIWVQLLVGVLLLLLYAAATWWGGVISAGDRRQIMALARCRLATWPLPATKWLPWGRRVANSPTP